MDYGDFKIWQCHLPHNCIVAPNSDALTILPIPLAFGISDYRRELVRVDLRQRRLIAAVVAADLEEALERVLAFVEAVEIAHSGVADQPVRASHALWPAA
jgi:hypothetical protein